MVIVKGNKKVVKFMLKVGSNLINFNMLILLNICVIGFWFVNIVMMG